MSERAFSPNGEPSVRIAIDCRTTLSPKTGDRTYTLNLLSGLATLEPSEWPQYARNWHFELLINAPAPEGLLPASERFQTSIIPGENSRLWTLAALPGWAWSARPNLIHVQYLGPVGLPCPFVTTIHDVVWRARPGTFPLRDKQVMRLFMPATVRLARRVLTVSRASVQEIERFFPAARGRVDHAPNAVDQRFFAPVPASAIETVRQKYGLGAAPYILSVGVLQPRKNVPRLIQAFRQLKRKHPEWPHQLVITGKPGWGPDAELARRNPDVKFTGYVDDAELPTLYAGATVFAYPSLYEGFGLPVIEAQAGGTAVLTSNCSSLPEVAGEAALLVPPRSAEAIAEGLEKLLGDDAFRAELAAKGPAHAAQFSVKRQALDTLACYQRALAAR